MSELVLVEHGPGFRTLALNRPARLNAFDDALHAALQAALAAADADDDCRAFSAGADLASGLGDDLGVVLENSFNPLIRRIRGLRMPVVAAVNGVAAGAGANVALACDVVLAGRGARFVQAFVRIGLIPDAGGTWLLPRLAGEARARGMAMLGEPVAAEQALAWGLIWQVVDDERLVAEAQALAARLALQPTAAIAAMKRAFAAGAGNTLDEQLDVERDLQRAAGYGPDYAEGVRALTEKRPAVFTGKA